MTFGIMRIIGFLLLVLLGSGVVAQEAPRQADVLRAMRLANGHFMAEWPDPGAGSAEWNRAVYYEGLMALYSIDPEKKYYDYSVEWGTKHQWMPVDGVGTGLADNQCAGQTWIDLFGIDAQPEQIRNIKENVDRMVRSGMSDNWYWIDALQMAMPVFVRLGVLQKDTA